jgi:hypothetical protein
MAWAAKILYQRDLLVGERAYFSATQHNHADSLALAFERDCENGVKSARSLTLGESVFRIGFDVGNLDRLAGKQDPPGSCAPPRHNWGSLNNFYPFLGETEIGGELHRTIPRSVDGYQIGLA